jgi:MtaA/CmuA family methyltransferase
MNSLDRLQRVLQAQPVDQTPNFDIFMTRAARQIGAPLARYYQDYRVLVEANLAVWQAFQLDIVQTTSDPYREAADAGLKVDFPADGLPISRQPLIIEPEDLGRVRFPADSFGPRMTDRLEAVRALRAQVGDRVPVLGSVEGALAEAAVLCGMNSLMRDMVMRPAWLHELLEKCTEVALAFAGAQIDAGAHLIGLGDAVASQISPRMYRQFALPYEQRIFGAIKARGAIPRLHICGNITHLLPDIGRCGADIVDLDWMVDLHQASVILNGLALCGNLDPVAVYLQGTPEAVRAGILANAAVGYPRWISMAGCEIPEQTPPENLLAQAQTLRDLAGRAAL